MTVKLHTELDNHVVTIHATDKLTKMDYHHFTRIVDQLIKDHGTIRIVLEMHDFHGWEPEAIWEDIKFDIQHFCHIERLAMVGDKQWEKGMCLFCRPFTSAKIRYFDEYEVGKAQAWIHADLDIDKTDDVKE